MSNIIRLHANIYIAWIINLWAFQKIAAILTLVTVRFKSFRIIANYLLQLILKLFCIHLKFH